MCTAVSYSFHMYTVAKKALLVDRESTRADEIAQRKYLDEFQKLSTLPARFRVGCKPVSLNGSFPFALCAQLDVCTASRRLKIGG